MNIKKEIFGHCPKGEKVFLYTLVNPNGITVKITNYGAIITSIMMPDKNGNRENIVLGFNELDEYLSLFWCRMRKVLQPNRRRQAIH